jgi:hypothetical protein
MGGSERFVRNQTLMAEDIAQGREVARCRPLYIAMGASTYCNYDCVMCVHGRTPRIDLRDAVWEELYEFLPTARSLTLLGGEPLAVCGFGNAVGITSPSAGALNGNFAPPVAPNNSRAISCPRVTAGGNARSANCH